MGPRALSTGERFRGLGSASASRDVWLIAALLALAGLGANSFGDVTGTVVAAKPATLKAPSGSAKLSVTAVEQKVFEEINQVRTQRGLKPVQQASDLTSPTREHSRYMAVANRITHRDGHGRSPGERLDACGINWVRYGENVGLIKGYADPAHRAVQAWLRSPGHAANILNPSLTESAVGVAVAADGTYFLTQVFITR
jgi:uncharacterized protein YkwD